MKTTFTLSEISAEVLASTFTLPPQEISSVKEDEKEGGGKFFFLDCSSKDLCLPTTETKIDLDLEIAYRHCERVGLFE